MRASSSKSFESGIRSARMRIFRRAENQPRFAYALAMSRISLSSVWDVDYAKFRDRHNPVYDPRSSKCRLQPLNQSRGILHLKDRSHHYVVGMTFDLLGGGLQSYVRAVSCSIRGGEARHEIALFTEIVE